MPNPIFLKTAERWRNEEVPEDRPSSKGKSQKKSPIRIPDFDYSFLGEELGREMHEAIVRKYSADHPFVTQNVSYGEKSGLIKGSRPGYVIAVNEFLRDNGLRTATSYDVQKVIEGGELDTSEVYEDLSLVLYGESGENEYLARDLANQVRQRNRSLFFPTMFNLNELELKVDQDAPKGLAFKLIDESQIIVASELAHGNDLKKFSKLNENGIPVFEDNGNYTFYAGNSGLRRLIRYGNSDLGARYRDLVNSSEDGRVIVCAEGTSPKK